MGRVDILNKVMLWVYEIGGGEEEGVREGVVFGVVLNEFCYLLVVVIKGDVFVMLVSSIVILWFKFIVCVLYGIWFVVIVEVFG